MPARFRKIAEDVCAPRRDLPKLYQQWVDVQNLDHMDTTAEKRAKRLSIVVRSLADFDRDQTYQDLKQEVDEYAREYGIHRENVRITESHENYTLKW